jgi:hypothetical protein
VTFLHRLVAMDGLVSVTDRLGDTNLRFVCWSDVFRSNAVSWRFSWDRSAKRGLLDRFDQPGVDWYLVPVRNCVQHRECQALRCCLRAFEGFMSIFVILPLWASEGLQCPSLWGFRGIFTLISSSACCLARGGR